MTCARSFVCSKYCSSLGSIQAHVKYHYLQIPLQDIPSLKRFQCSPALPWFCLLPQQQYKWCTAFLSPVACVDWSSCLSTAFDWQSGAALTSYLVICQVYSCIHNRRHTFVFSLKQAIVFAKLYNVLHKSMTIKVLSAFYSQSVQATSVQFPRESFLCALTSASLH